MNKQIIKAILMVFIFLTYSCDKNDKNINESYDNGIYADYLTISSIYRGTGISSKIKVSVLEVKTGEIISQTTHEIPDIDNNIFTVSEDIKTSSNNISFGKNIIQDDNVLINYYAEEDYSNNDFRTMDSLFIIHIDKINGYFIFSITEFNNTENKYLFYGINYFSNDSRSGLTTKSGTLENIELFGQYIKSLIYEKTENEKEANNTTRLIMNIVNEIYL